MSNDKPHALCSDGIRPPRLYPQLPRPAGAMGVPPPTDVLLFDELSAVAKRSGETEIKAHTFIQNRPSRVLTLEIKDESTTHFSTEAPFLIEGLTGDKLIWRKSDMVCTNSGSIVFAPAALIRTSADWYLDRTRRGLPSKEGQAEPPTFLQPYAFFFIKTKPPVPTAVYPDACDASIRKEDITSETDSEFRTHGGSGALVWSKTTHGCLNSSPGLSRAFYTLESAVEAHRAYWLGTDKPDEQTEPIPHSDEVGETEAATVADPDYQNLRLGDYVFTPPVVHSKVGTHELGLRIRSVGYDTICTYDMATGTYQLWSRYDGSYQGGGPFKCTKIYLSREALEQAEATGLQRVDIQESLAPDLIDQMTDAQVSKIYEFLREQNLLSIPHFRTRVNNATQTETKTDEISSLT